MSFDSLGLSAPLLDAAQKYAAPTPVQSAAIPVVLSGVDILATAQTGSGKTVAFVFPLLQRWLGSPRGKRQGVHTLFLVPTRELAAQVRDVVQDCARFLPQRIKVVSAVGGVSLNPQMMALRGGADFVVATPGRLLDLVDHRAIQLDETRALVLDEADRMLDLGFAKELARILDLLPQQRQNLLFSATFPKAVASVADAWLNEPTRIVIDDPPEQLPDIHQRAIRVDHDKRGPLLRHLIKQEGWERVLVFVSTQYTANHVAEKLRRHGVKAESFHGDLSQGARNVALAGFKDVSSQVLVATDLASRGLDIVGLPVVLNYDLPRSTNDFTHRIGRTGRAGETGLAVSFITAESDAHFRLIEKRQKMHIPREEIEGFEPLEPALPAPAAGGVKGRRPNKKDKLREAAAREKYRSGRASDAEREPSKFTRVDE